MSPFRSTWPRVKVPSSTCHKLLRGEGVPGVPVAVSLLT